MQSPHTSDRLAWSVHITLLIGLLITAAMLILGGVLMITAHGTSTQGPPPGLRSLLSQAAKGEGAAFLNLGLFVLMLTPVARVIVLAAGWLSARQWRFGLIALCVLTLLGLSIFLGTG